MRAIKPVIQLAKERALFRFSALAIRMLQDATTSVAQQAHTATTVHEQKTFAAAREWLATQGPVFLKRLYASYCGYVERGMQTMYRDLRQGLQDVSADTWALIDDDTIVRQIEVERRVLRLRDADQLSLGRLNLMIAQLHDEHDVRERENPFRPYLMARALHDVLCEMSSTSDLCALLFDHLSGALATQLPDYFAAIREVFESNGVHARLLARPSLMNRRDREILEGLPGFSNTVIVQGGGNYSGDQSASPSMERVLSLLQQRSADAPNVLRTPQQENQSSLQDFVWKIFNQAVPDRAPSNTRSADGQPNIYRQGAEDESSKPHPLTSQLHRLQQEVLNSTAAQGDAIHLLDLHSELETERLSEMERVSMDLVAMLFDYIGRDSSIPAAFRGVIVRLQVPFMRATMQAPHILELAEHPLRKLLNRMASLAMALDAQSSPGSEIRLEIMRAVDKILSDFKSDMTIFSDALAQLDAAVAQILRETDADLARAIDALEEAEKDPQRQDVLVIETVNALRERLLTVQTDQRAVDFLIKIWARVLVHVDEDDSIDKQPYRDAIAELIWSVQQHDVTERSVLMKLLPRLIKQLKSGMKLIALSENATRQAIDDLIAMHAHVLGMIQAVPLKASTSMESLRQHFSGLRIGGAPAENVAIHAPTVPHIRLQAMLQKFDVTAHLHLDSDIGTLLNSDVSWLGGMQLGTAVEWWADKAYEPARLMWVNQQQSFYVFQAASEQTPRLLIYSSISLIKGLREGSIGMIEYAPLFERAIQSLLSTDSVQQQLTA